MEQQIEGYLAYLSVERGLAQNTLDAYGRDLRAYARFLQKHNLTSFQDTEKEAVRAYLEQLHNLGRASSTCLLYTSKPRERSSGRTRRLF